MKKTLDEVIKALELCTGDDCTGYKCPYRQEGTCCDLVAVPKMQADALHYLKWFKARDEMSRKIDAEDDDQLSWEELKQMEGKPVWVVEKGYQTWEFWGLVYWMQDDELTLLNENGQTTYSKNEQGDVWQAYRKERS